MRELTVSELQAVSGGGWQQDALEAGGVIISGVVGIVGGAVAIAASATVAAALLPAVAIVGGIIAVGYGMYCMYEAMEAWQVEMEWELYLLMHGGY